MVGKVCIIGGGPSGLAVLAGFAKMQREGQDIPELVCYEKQSNWGGLWNYTWRTGSDQHGEPVHGSMYRYLWSNGPKETLEFPQYTFEEHFGKAIPSFPPREVLFDYLQGRWKKEDIKKYVKFNTVVRDVCYNKETDDFTVSVKRLDEDQVEDGERFDYVVVASGHYSVPNVPSFPGIDRFPGRVLHSHDFREANEFTGKRLLCIGASYSAEDIALQCIKYGAESVVISYRTKAMGFNWPKEITERPLVDRFEGKTVHFKDGSSSEVDAVIMCTGYLHSYPYLREELRLKASNVLYPPGLYKGLVWQKGGNNKLLYSGVQDQYYTYTMFDVCGLWIAKLIQGKVQLPDRDTMEKDWKTWHARCGTLNSDAEDISFQTDFIQDLVKDLGDDYPYNVDTQEIFNTWEHHKVEDILSYRDKSFASKYTGTPSPIHHTTFMKALDDSMATFLDQRKN
ncbi:flavin-containing monooxygenase FMO GS-OX3 isoform X1 [Eurytemora carolleeae]|uniref:flavin-containing monooxygenase FMO GS-OX3 isoform X1 n=2 Tax=Eurytemora carolleeae TaxID=1294199 RepID=UPI000C76DEBA|nr:flavin-containing monooxygenase FMO GS-OX3 isoform X1 [Eurytemora carolleeae]|eukprot:XP_023330765.1 flavin-containing monooxygenase FMO GS-OX3-like isoform X1 [Eurytemora affinis]